MRVKLVESSGEWRIAEGRDRGREYVRPQECVVCGSPTAWGGEITLLCKLETGL